MPDGNAYKKNVGPPKSSSPPASGASSGQSGGSGGGSGGSDKPAASQSAGPGSAGGGGGSGASPPPAQKSGSAGSGGGSGSSSPPAAKSGSAGNGGGSGSSNQGAVAKGISSAVSGGGGGSGTSKPPQCPVGKGIAHAVGGASGNSATKAAGATKAAESAGTGPVGQGDYEVGPGECMSSIALDKGYFWRTIWDHAPNSELKSVRKDPNVLLPKDLVTLPTKNEKKESGATEMRHRFVRRGEPSHFRFQAKVEDEPLRNSDYVLTIDGKKQEGVTDAEGWIEVDLPGNAHSGVLVITCEGQEYRFALNLGHMEPVTELTGVQKRLKNLGFPPGPIDGKMGPKTRSAIAQFQKSQSMEPTGELDEGTRQKLAKAHGC